MSLSPSAPFKYWFFAPRAALCYLHFCSAQLTSFGHTRTKMVNNGANFSISQTPISRYSWFEHKSSLLLPYPWKKNKDVLILCELKKKQYAQEEEYNLID